MNYLTQPAATAPAYQRGALLYELADEYPYTARVDNGGFLQLNMSSANAGEFTVGELVWVESLEGFDLIDSGVAEIIDVDDESDPAFIQLLVAYNAGFAGTGVVRKLQEATFVVRTGRPSEVQLREESQTLTPNLEGKYTINIRDIVTARFSYDRTPADSDNAHDTQFALYLEGESVPALKTALKQILGTSAGLTIANTCKRQWVSYQDAGSYKVALEPLPASYEPDVPSVDLFLLAGKEYALTLTDPVEDEFTVIGNPDNIPFTLVTNSGGQIINGVIIKPSAAGAYSFTIEESTGGGTRLYQFRFLVQGTIKTIAKGAGTELYWWNPKGGWSYYAFDQGAEVGMESAGVNQALVQSKLRQVSADYQFENRTLTTRPEREEVFDYLNDIYLTNEIWIYEDEIWKQCVLPNATKQSKTAQPYKAADNQFILRLIVAEVKERINEGL